MNAWLMGVELDNFGSGKFLEYDVAVNNEKQADKLKPVKNNWHNGSFNDSKSKEKKLVKLQKGLNQIIFSCDAPEIPDIEFIRLSKDKAKTEISESNYNQFVDQIKTEIQERVQNPKAKKDSLASMLKSGVVLPNPAGNYYHRIDITFRYTTYKIFSFNSGQQVFFSTYAADKYEHVLEVFNSSNPEAYTWVAKSNSNGLASLNINIPSTGIYYVRVRAYRQETQGLVDLNVNGQFYYVGCAVSGSGFRHAHETPTTYNYFTCKLTGDSRIWIEDDSGIPGKIRAFNDDYYGGGDFSWGLASRVKKDFSVRIGAALVSAYSSFNPVGTCDVYIMCQNSNIMPYFPNLKADDAIQSAPPSTVYNCISWSGGIYWDWHWPPSPFDPYYSGSPLASFDNFYGSVRYTGAMTYSRSGATSSNSTVDLWALNGEYTHGSVTKPGNKNPHGYDWESKPGSLMRTFHPRNALNGSSYGAVDKYYRITSGLKSAMLLDESIARGLSVIENVELTAAEKNILSDKINLLTINQQSEFENKYAAWKQTWENPEISMHSNPRMYAKSKEYQELIDYCKGHGKSVWPMIFNKFQQGDFFTINALEDLTLTENQDVLDKVKKETNLKSTNESGAKIVRFPRTIAMKYIKELLKSSDNATEITDEGITYSNSFKFNVFPNPSNATSQVSFNLPANSKVSAQLVDLNGRVLSIIINEQLLTAGNHSYNVSIPEGFKGTCLVKLLVNNNVNIQLIVAE